MTTIRTITITAVALAASGAVASAADAPKVSAEFLSPRATAPVTIPGTGVKAGQRLPKGAKLVYREVTISGKQTTTFSMKSLKGTTLQGLAPDARVKVGFTVVGKDADYVGDKAVTVKAFAARSGASATGRIYALVK